MSGETHEFRRRLNQHARAIADPNRRRILDLLLAQAGMNVQQLCGHFEISRFAVMKHLHILEESGLIRRERERTSKYLFATPHGLQDSLEGSGKHMRHVKITTYEALDENMVPDRLKQAAT
jgi:DNA-binding transcriptional ArsR family regulator